MKGARTTSRSVLEELTAPEKADLLDRLLAAQPQLRAQAEALAVERMASDDQAEIAEEVESALRYLGIDELSGRAGYRPGQGYIHECEAADEILDEALEPFLTDLDRRAQLGLIAAATRLAVGILVGLSRCREGGSESLLEYAPDFAAERADEVVNRCRQHGIVLPVAELLHLAPGWAPMLSRD
ncbi:MAG: hypothetical protein WCG47_31870 [Dermatophilaceae bacterium]